MRIPLGIPSVTYCRVVSAPNGQSNDIVADGPCVTVIGSSNGERNNVKRYEVSAVLERNTTDEEACELTIGSKAGSGIGAALNPLKALVYDSASSVIFVVGSKQTKKSQFIHRTLLPFVANELFSTIQEKEEQITSNQSSEFRYKAQVGLSCFEIEDEIITDLLRPANRGMDLRMTAEEGIQVKSIQKELVLGEADLRRLLVDACNNRGTHSLPVGASIDTASAVFELTLFQSEIMGGGTSVKDTYCRLLIVDVPSVDPLLSRHQVFTNLSPDQDSIIEVDARERPSQPSSTLHQGLYAFSDVVKSISTPHRATIAPFRSAKLTHFLSEILGGNAIVVAIGLVSCGEASVSHKTMELLSALNNAVHYPIGGAELSDVLQGLLSKYRSLVIQIQDEVNTKEGIITTSRKVELDLERRLMDVQQELAATVSDQQATQMDLSRIQALAERLKKKYLDLVDSKTAQTNNFASLEETKLSLAKAMAEQKLLSNQIQEEQDKQIFELSCDALKHKEDFEGLQSINSDLDAENTKYQEQYETSHRELNKIIGDIAHRDRSIEELKKSAEEEKEKNMELAAEALTLVNRREVVEKELEIKVTKENAHREEIEKLKSDLEERIASIAPMERDLKAQATEILQLKNDNLDLEGENQNHKKALAEWDRSKAVVRGATEQYRRQSTVGNIDSLPVQGSKEVRSLEAKLARCQAELEEQRKLKCAAEEDASELRTSHRQKLSSLLSQFQLDVGYLDDHNHVGAPPDKIQPHLMRPQQAHRDLYRHKPVGAKTDHDDAAEDHDRLFQMESTITVVLQKQLIDSYQLKERKNNQMLDDSFQQKDAILTAYRQVYDKYREVMDVIQALIPKVAQDASKKVVLEEQFRFGTNQLKESEKTLDAFYNHERKTGKERVERSEQSAQNEMDNMLSILSIYQKKLENAEGRLTKITKENIDLHVQVKKFIQSSGAASSNERIFGLGKDNSPMPIIPQNTANSALSIELRQAETRAVEATSEATAMIEELEHYKAFMKTKMQKHNRQVQYLKKQLESAGLGIAGGEDSEHKLPQIPSKK